MDHFAPPLLDLKLSRTCYKYVASRTSQAVNHRFTQRLSYQTQNEHSKSQPVSEIMRLHAQGQLSTVLCSFHIQDH